jgi:hypothetical protein
MLLYYPEMRGKKTYLEDKESFMIQINPATLEQRLYLGEIARTTIDGILARIILERRTSNDQIRVGDYLECVWTRLHSNLRSKTYILTTK